MKKIDFILQSIIQSENDENSSYIANDKACKREPKFIIRSNYYNRISQFLQSQVF